MNSEYYGPMKDVSTAVSGTATVISFIVAVIMIISWWKIYQKAGEHGWAAIIPFYNLYVFAKIAWGNGWLFLIFFAAVIPIVGAIIAAIFFFVTTYKLGKSFGKGILFILGMIVFPYIFYPILGFGSSRYQGVN